MNPIPIESLVQEAKKDFVSWVTGVAMASILTWAPWLAPVSKLVEFILKLFIAKLVEKGELGAFILNAKVLTSDQAKDYREAVAKRILAPDDIPDDKWEEIEREANDKMVQLVRVSA